MTGQHQYEALKLAISDAIFGKSMDTVDELMELVTAYAATVEREAAVSEVKRLNGLVTARQFHVPSRYKVYDYMNARLAALQGPLDNNNEGETS